MVHGSHTVQKHRHRRVEFVFERSRARNRGLNNHGLIAKVVVDASTPGFMVGDLWGHSVGSKS